MSASASGIRAGQAYVELLADDSRLRAGLASAQRQIAAWGASVRRVGIAVFAAGAGMLAPLLAATQQFASTGDALAKMAIRTGLSVELLSELAHAANLSGASLEDLEKASRKLSVTIIDALKGSGSAINALGGASLAKQLAALPPDQRFLTVARAIGMIPDPARRAAAAIGAFGKSGTRLLPLIAEMDSLRAEARKLGLTMSGDQANRAAALQDAWERLEGALKRIITTIGAALAPALTRLAGDVLPVLTRLRVWISQNQATVVSIAKVAAILAGVGAAVLALSGVITTASWVFGALGIAVGVVSTSLGAMRGIVTATSVVWRLLTMDLLACRVAMTTTAAASAITSTAMATARVGVLALALAFGRVRGSAVMGLVGITDLLARITTAARLAGGALLRIRRSVPTAQVSMADRGRATVAAGGQVAGRLASGAGSAARTAVAGIAAMLARIGAAFGAMTSRALAALGAIRTGLVGLQLSAAMLGNLVVTGLSRAFQAVPGMVGRALTVIPRLVTVAWSGMAVAARGTVAGVGAAMQALPGVMSGALGALRSGLGSLPGLAVSAGRGLVAGLGAGLGALRTVAFTAIGVAATAVQALPGLISGGFGLIRAAVVALPGLFSAAFSMLPALIGLAMNPVVLLGAAIVGLGVYLYQTSDSGRAAMSQLSQAFAEVRDDAVAAFGAIGDAVAGGNIMGAVKILWAFIQLEWTRGVSWVQNFMQAFAGGLAKLFLNVGFGINTAFWTVVYGIQDAIDWVVAGIAKIFSTVIGNIASKVAYLMELVGAVDDGTSQKVADLSQNINAGIDQTKAQRAGERDQKLSNFKGLWDEKIQGVNQWMAEGMQGRDAEIAAKRAELDAAIAEAKKATNASASPAGHASPTGLDGAVSPTAPDGESAVVPELDTTALSAALADRMGTVQTKMETLGTFNAAAVSQVGIGGSATERTAKATEETAKNTAKIARAVEDNELAFE